MCVCVCARALVGRVCVCVCVCVCAFQRARVRVCESSGGQLTKRRGRRGPQGLSKGLLVRGRALRCGKYTPRSVLGSTTGLWVSTAVLLREGAVLGAGVHSGRRPIAARRCLWTCARRRLPCGCVCVCVCVCVVYIRELCVEGTAPLLTKIGRTLRCQPSCHFVWLALRAQQRTVR